VIIITLEEVEKEAEGWYRKRISPSVMTSWPKKMDNTFD